METLLETVHGSHLYGLNHANSDLDTYRVVAGLKRGRQNIDNENNDVVRVPLGKFMVMTDAGSPQALEAMFSPYSHGSLKAFADMYYVNPGNMARTYLRTLTNFARLGIMDLEAKSMVPLFEESGHRKNLREGFRAKKPRRVERNGMAKYRRHSVRLLLNLTTAMDYGRFNPKLTASEIEIVMKVSHLDDYSFAEYMVSKLG